VQSLEQRKRIRHALIAIAARRHRPGSGSDVAFLRQTGGAAPMEVASFDFLGVPWCLVGALAANRYMSPRHTNDLDIAILESDRHLAYRALRQAGFRYGKPLSIGGAAWVSPSGTPLDVIEMRHPWAAQALREADALRRENAPVMPLPYLVLMKLEASRTTDVADLARMLALADPAELDRIRAMVERWAPADREDMEQLVALGRAELQE